jgi:predicted GTPase
MGYSDRELADLARTINESEAEVVVAGTPSDLGHLMQLNKPVVRARYEYADVGEPRLGQLLAAFLRERGLGRVEAGA